jgi:hypothetical protein
MILRAGFEANSSTAQTSTFTTSDQYQVGQTDRTHIHVVSSFPISSKTVSPLSSR